MIDIIIKRDGRKVPFDPQKITDAIMKAFRACNSAKTIKTAEQLTRQVLDELEKNECIGEPSVKMYRIPSSAYSSRTALCAQPRAISSTAPSAAASAR